MQGKKLSCILFLGGKRMDLTVTFYDFAKRPNSVERITKRTAATVTATGKYGLAVNAMSVTNPVIIFEKERNPFLFNYRNADSYVWPDKCRYASIKWPSGQSDTLYIYKCVRLYYLQDVQFLNDGRVAVTLREDVLGTFRNHILQSVQQVERTNVYANTDYAEQVIPVKSQPTLVKQYLDSPFSVGTGYYIIGCVAEEVYPVGHSWDSMFSPYGITLSQISDNDCVLMQAGTLIGSGSTGGVQLTGSGSGYVDLETGDISFDTSSSGTTESTANIEVDNLTPPSQFTKRSTATFSRGGVRYYTFSSVEAQNFIQCLGRLQGAAADFDLSKYFVSCTYIPFEDVPSSQIETVDTCFHFGNDKSNQIFVFCRGRSRILEAYAPGGVYTYDAGTVTFMKHPSYSASAATGKVTTKYINYEPYLDCSLVYGPFGTLDIPMNVVANSSGVDYHIVLEFDLGDGLGNLRLVRTPSGISPLNTSATYINSIITITSAKQKISASIPLVSITSDSYSKHLGYEIQYAKSKVKTGANMIGDIANAIPKMAAASTPGAGLISNTGQMLAAEPKGLLSAGVDNGLAMFEAQANHTLAQYNNSIPTVYQTPSNGSFLGFNETLDYCLMYTVLEIDEVQPDFYNTLIGKQLNRPMQLQQVLNVGINVGLYHNVFVKCTGAALVAYTASTTVSGFSVWNFTSARDLSAERTSASDMGSGLYEPTVAVEEYNIITEALNSGIYLY